jgi:hypothetical protein
MFFVSKAVSEKVHFANVFFPVIFARDVLHDAHFSSHLRRADLATVDIER